MWGSPDLPHSFNFPTYKDEEGDDVHYVFVCQINCSEITPHDTGGILPHKGMLYFFAKLDCELGNFMAEPLQYGFCEKGDIKVLFWPHDDTASLEETVLIDEDGTEVAPSPCAISFSHTDEDPESPSGGCKMLGSPAGTAAERIDMERFRLLFQLDNPVKLYFLIPAEDLGKTFRNVSAYHADC